MLDININVVYLVNNNEDSVSAALNAVKLHNVKKSIDHFFLISSFILNKTE